MLALLIAAAVAQPGRDPTLLHRDAGAVVAAKEQEQEAALRRMLELGGSPAEQAEALARLAGLLRSRGLAASIRAQVEADEGNEAGSGRRRGARRGPLSVRSLQGRLVPVQPGRIHRRDEALQAGGGHLGKIRRREQGPARARGAPRLRARVLAPRQTRFREGGVRAEIRRRARA